MDWVGQAATWLRGVLDQPSLEPLQSAISRMPDWALLSAGPAALLLIALMLRFIRRQLARHPNTVAQPPATVPQAHQPAPETQRKEREAAAPRGPAAAAPTPSFNGTLGAATAEPGPKAEAIDAGGPDHGAAPTAATVSRASGVPDENEQERKARVFLSSTFRDMKTEREVLATDTFPSLKRKFRARGVEVQEVDLRWGVNEGDATLDVCLHAVRRSNWFVGLIGQRYGTTLEDKATVAQLGPDFRAVHQGLGRSLTEIEILEGVLLNDKADKQTLFFERDSAWLDTLSSSERPEYEDHDTDAQTKLAELKTRIRERVGIMHAYASPKEIDAVFEQAMSEALEKAFPPVEGADDPFMQEHRLHAAYARERLGLYVGGADYLNQLDAWMAQHDAPPKIVCGASGGGKSTLIAHWTSRWVHSHRNDIVFAHYLGASPDSANPAALVRRLWLHLNRVTGEDIAIPSPGTELDDLCRQVSERLAQAAAFAAREKCFILLALDGLDKLQEEHRDLRWWPRALSPHIRVLASSLDGKARDAARERNWSELVVKPFDDAEQGAFIADTLRGWNKSDFPEARKRRVLGHALAGLPMFLRTILEELRVSAANNVLDARLDDYLKAADMPDLHGRILAQIEQECGKDFVAQALSLIWASRAGLEENEITAIVAETQHMTLGSAGLAWERLRNRLADNLRDSQGRVAFSHDYLRGAVESRYLLAPERKRLSHLALADRFETRAPDARQAEELPYQLRSAEAWQRLEALLTDLDRLSLLRRRGDIELISYWEPLKARQRSPDDLLCGAFDRRTASLPQWNQAEFDLAVHLLDFLRFAGSRGDSIKRFAEKCSRSADSVLGPDHPMAWTFAQGLAEVLNDCGDHNAAFELEKRVFDAQLRAQGQTQGTGAILVSMGRTLKLLGDLQGSATLLERGVKILSGVLGEENEGTLLALANLANTRTQLGYFAAASELQNFILDVRSRTLGLEHPKTASSMIDLATTYARSGLHELARPLYERALEALKRTLGDHHPDALKAASGVAAVLVASGEHALAQASLEALVNLHSRVLGPDHDETYSTKHNLATVLLLRGDLDRGRELLESVSLAMALVRGPEHHDVLKSFGTLATVYAMQGDLDRARELFQTVLQGQTRTLGAEHPDTQATATILAEIMASR